MSRQVIEVQPRRTLPAGRGCGPGAPVIRPDAPPGRCPVAGCGAEIDQSRLMCRRDWYAIPKPLRDRVWATWRSGRAMLGADHKEAVGQAILVSQALRHEPAAG
jgi:hypothetical protein